MTLPGEHLSPFQLRLGNWVLGPTGEPVRIEYLSVKFHPGLLGKPSTATNKNINHGINGFTGLPLSERWLIKLGFEKVDENWRLGIDEMILYSKGQTSYGLASLPSLEIRFVHELQNLMFVVRGFEEFPNI